MMIFFSTYKLWHRPDGTLSSSIDFFWRFFFCFATTDNHHDADQNASVVNRFKSFQMKNFIQQSEKKKTQR